MNKVNFCTRLGVAVLAAGIAYPLQAAIEEVLVTATKREQSIDDIGISVSAVTGSELAARGISDSTEITAAIPNIINAFIYGPGSSTNFSIRGIAQNDYNDGTESPNAAYVDDVYLVPTGAASFPLHDMNRVEVLRGPQGTLFGRNSTGGLIHYITNRPTDEFEASVSGSYGRFDEFSIGGMVNVPLTDSVSLRLSGRTSDSNGWSENQLGLFDDAGQTKTESFRGQVLWTPNDDITSLFKVSYEEASGLNSAVSHTPIGRDAATGDLYVLGANEDYYGTGPGLSSFGQPKLGGQTENYLGSVRMLKKGESRTLQNTTNWTVSETLDITSITAFNRYERDQTNDCDGTPLEICLTHWGAVSRQFTQEFRAYFDLGDFRATTGIYYLDQDIKSKFQAPLVLRTFLLDAFFDQDAKGYAAFVNTEFDLSDKLTLIAGVRVAKDEKDVNQLNSGKAPCTAPAVPNYQNDFVVPDCAAAPDGTPYPGGSNLIARNDFTGPNGQSINENTWSGKLELDYTPTEDSLIYASISRGTKAAGFNNGNIALGLSADKLGFDSEEILAYEVGYKGSFWDRRARFTASVFYYDYQDFQALSFEGVGSFINNRDAELTGAEFELALQPIDGLTLELNGGYSDTELKDQPNTLGIIEDREMALAPSWTMSWLARYEMPAPGDQHSIGFQLNGNARDSFYNNPDNDSAAEVENFRVVNARIDLNEADGKYRLSLVGKNLMDDDFRTSTFMIFDFGLRYSYWNQPRSYALEFAMNF